MKTADDIEHAINMFDTERLKEFVKDPELTNNQRAEVEHEIHMRETTTANNILKSWGK